MADTHTAAVLHGAQDMRIETRTTTSPKPDEVQIRIRATGICGTDMHYYQAGKNGMFVVRQPLVPGHEAAGEIVAVGNNVQHFQVSIQELYNHPAGFVHKIPDNISFEEGALLEPLSVSLHAVRRSGVGVGQSVLVLGAGAVGLLCASLAQSAGASRVVIADIDQARLGFALGRNGAQRAVATASYMIDPARAKDLKEDFAKQIAREIIQSEGSGAADIVFECTGVESCCNIAINCAAPGRKAVLVGMGSPMQSLQIGAAAAREIDLLAVWGYANTFPTAIRLVQSAQVPLKQLVTQIFDLRDAEKALKTVLSKPADLIKCVISLGKH
ncbi:Dehydrogenase [Aspergillus sp. HF37]|nr:Dehydrogenase [Aspergillus sp. HF37]